MTAEIVGMAQHMQSVPLARRKEHKKSSYLTLACNLSADHTLTSGNSFPDIPVSNAKRPEKSENLSALVLLGNSLKRFLWWSLGEILVKQTLSF